VDRRGATVSESNKTRSAADDPVEDAPILEVDPAAWRPAGVAASGVSADSDEKSVSTSAMNCMLLPCINPPSAPCRLILKMEEVQRETAVTDGR
jgi:hypothetical protein